MNPLKETKACAALLLIAMLLLIAPPKIEAKCPTGGFAIINTLFSVCWECLFPITISGITIIDGPMKNQPLLSGARQPICTCPMPPPIFMRIGIPVGFFEASRIAETVSEAFCFPMFGFQIANPS